MKNTIVCFTKWSVCLACVGVLLFGPILTQAATISTVAAIPGANDGSEPLTGLIELRGQYYGTTFYGGSASGGTVYRVDLKTGTETVIHTFNGGSDGSKPLSLIAAAGKLYGTTGYGGSQGGGTVFSIDPTTGAEQVIFNPPSQTYLGVSFEYNGLLYGSGQCGNPGVSCLYTFDPVAATGQLVYSFNSSVDGNGISGLTLFGRYVYGTTSSGGATGDGTLFRFDPTTATLRLEHVFGSAADGSQPQAPLIKVGQILYGSTTAGGTSGDGTVFSFNPDMRQEAILHSFDGTDGGDVLGLSSANGMLYGVSYSGGPDNSGTLFSVDPATGQTKTLYDYGYPHEDQAATVIEAGGLLYGTMADTGVVSAGEVYSVDPTTGAFSTLHSFAGPETSSTSGLIKVNAQLYGTASGGGSNGLGSIFKLNPASGKIETLHSFNGLDGARPKGPLTEVGGIFYGTTSIGGPSDSGSVYSLGTVFSFDPATRTLTTLYQFSQDNHGGNPTSALTLDNGALYGTTPGNIETFSGTVFKIDLANLQLSNVYLGTRSQGIASYGLATNNGLLYGVGSNNGLGSLYQLDPATGTLTTLYTFQGGADGVSAATGLLYSNGMLFGGGFGGRGYPQTVFGFDLATAAKTTLHSYSVSFEFEGPLIAAGSKLFGNVTSRTLPYGAVLQLKATGGGAQTYPFASATGGSPQGSLLHVGSAYYGTTQPIGTTDAGTVFKFMP